MAFTHVSNLMILINLEDDESKANAFCIFVTQTCSTMFPDHTTRTIVSEMLNKLIKDRSA